MIYEPTAWYSYAQFSDLFNKISNLDNLENILFQIELWKAHGKVPAAIHATYLLLNVILCDRKSQIYESNIRDLYAMSIIRTVNLLLDQEQDSLYAKSMILMGKEANIPETIIKCRHRCSHGDIPDVESLRLISREAVNYIYRKYWIKQYHLINSRLNDDHQYSFLLFTTFLVCRSGMDTENNINSNNYFSFKKKYFINSKNLKKSFKLEYNYKSEQFKSLIECNNMIMSLIINKRNLSMNRNFNLYLQKNISYINKEIVEIFNFTTKKLLNSCIHEDIFISVFVEYVFCNYKPEQSELFFIFLFYTLSQYSFNFTLKLIAHMFNYILETNDLFTDLKTHYKDSINHIVKLYRELITNFNKDIINKDYLNSINLNKKDKDNHNNTNHINNYLNGKHSLNGIQYLNGNNYDKENLDIKKIKEHQDNVNNWLLELLHYGINLKNKQFSNYHIKYLKIIKVLSFDDYNKMINYEFTSLSRILVAIKLLSSLLLLKVPNTIIKQDINNWRSDKLSYLINILKCIENSGKYKYQIINEEEKNKLIMESKKNSKDLIQELNKNLLPGTIWDNQQCKVVQIYKMDGTYQVSTHTRIITAFEKIKKDDFIKYIEGNKKRDKIKTQIYNINGFINKENAVKVTYQKKLFKVISIITSNFKTLNNLQYNL